MRRFSFSGIRSRLILLFVVALVPIILLIGHDAREDRARILRQATAQSEAIFRFAVLNEQDILLETREILQRLAVTPGLPGRKDCGSYLSSLLSIYPRYLNFGVALPDGSLRCSARPTMLPSNISDRAYFRDAVEAGSFSNGGFQREQGSGNPMIVFGYPIPDEREGQAGVVLAGLDLSHVTEFEAEVSRMLPAGSTFVKTDSSGTVLSGIPGSVLYRVGDPLEKSVFERVSRSRQGNFTAVDTDGVERLYMFSTLWGTLYPSESHLLLGVPTKQLFAESKLELLRDFGILAMVALATGLLLWFGGNRLIVHPVDAIVGASGRLAGGDLSARVGFRKERGELGNLGRAFDDMAAKLERNAERLSEVQERLEHILAASPAVIYACRSLPDGKEKADIVPVFFSERLKDLLGYDPREVVGAVNWLEEHVHPEDFSLATDRTELLATGIQSREFRLRAKNGEYRWVVNQRVLIPNRGGAVRELEFVGSFTDITDRRQAEEAMVRLGMAVTQATEGVVILDPRGNVEYVNPAFEKITGYLLEDIAGRSLRIINSGRQDEAFYRGIEETVQKEGAWKGRIVNRKKDGTIYDEEATVFPVRNASGRIVNYVSLLKDVTQETLLQKQLQIAQRMEAVGTLAGGIAHDFNNALTGIFGFTEIAALKAEGNEEVLSSLQEIRRCGDRAATLTRQLLAYSRRPSAAPVNLVLNNVVTDLLKLVSKLVGEQIRIRTCLDRELPSIFADAGQMEQVLMNLVLNARDAMPAGGSLAIETSSMHADDEFLQRHPYMAGGKYVVLSVSDTGIGMDERTRLRVFDPFFTTKSPDKGTGLGLAMVYGIVKQHKGYIHLYSEPGRGTTFRIHLPAVDGPAAAARPPGLKETPFRGTETILLAEDDESVRALVKRTLAGLGYSVLEAASGEEAVALLERERDTVSLALLDVVMPTLGGGEAFEAMRALKPGIKAIFMSGYSDASVRESFGYAPGTPFLNKPFTPGALGKKVREVLDAPVGT